MAPHSVPLSNSAGLCAFKTALEATINRNKIHIGNIIPEKGGIKDKYINRALPAAAWALALFHRKFTCHKRSALKVLSQSNPYT